MTQPVPIPTIDVAEAARRLQADPVGTVLLDVRELGEFVEVRAPGAVLLPMSALVARLAELPANAPLLVICHSGNRSAAVASYLGRAGRLDIFNVAGGMEAWERAGLPVRRGRLETGEGDFPPS